MTTKLDLMMPDVAPKPITIKKYANRRLYNTATSSYVTLDNLCQMVKAGADFAVFDARTGENITRSVLTQIIVEEESKGANLLPISFLRQLIGFYGNSMQWLVPSYLDSSMKNFSQNQDQMRQHLHDAFGGIFPFGSFEAMAKQNMALVERAMTMFSPFSAGQPEQPERGAAPDGPIDAAANAALLRQLKQQLDVLQRQVEMLRPPPQPLEE